MKRFGLIGYPLDHSFSPKWFAEKFDREQIEASYAAYPIKNLDQLLELVRDQKLDGFNVTIPHKQAIIPYLDRLDKHAEDIGAVNTVLVNNQKLIGYNTDYLGFYLSLRELVSGIKSALVLGTGGASLAIISALKLLDIDVQLVSRSKAGYLTYSVLDEHHILKNKLIVNCSPVGTYPNIDAKPSIPYKHLGPDHLVYDVVYNPGETTFLKTAKEAGATTKNGYEMLVFQAEESWKIWNKTI